LVGSITGDGASYAPALSLTSAAGAAKGTLTEAALG